MFLHHCFLLLATLPSFTLLASAFRNRHFERRPHARAALSLASTGNDNTTCIPAEPADTVTTRLNQALSNSGSGFILSLCPNEQYQIQAPIIFTAPNQEISTAGYPTDSSRATLVVSGAGQTTGVDGTCGNCGGVKLRNVQINGNRAGAPIYPGGANIEMGGSNSNQVIEFVHSFDTRGWSCLHIAEGALSCNGVVVQNNDVGPCGSDANSQWADGISVSCRSAIVRNNVVTDPTDGGIVLFGSPGTLVENNTIQVIKSTALGGINLVDVVPWGGDYTGVLVQNNVILGGFATDSNSLTQKDGLNENHAIIKIGTAIGPQTWFISKFGTNVSFSGSVINNKYSGAFGYAMAITSARNFTVQGNALFGNTSFISSRGPNCAADDPTPPSASFIRGGAITDSTIQSDFNSVPDANGLTCIEPPNGGNYWPYNVNSGSTPPVLATNPEPSSGQNSTGLISSTSSLGPSPSSPSGQNSSGPISTTSSLGPSPSSPSGQNSTGPISTTSSLGPSPSSPSGQNSTGPSSSISSGSIPSPSGYPGPGTAKHCPRPSPSRHPLGPGPAKHTLSASQGSIPSSSSLHLGPGPAKHTLSASQGSIPSPSSASGSISSPSSASQGSISPSSASQGSISSPSPASQGSTPSSTPTASAAPGGR